AIQNERANLWNVMGKLQEYAVLAQALDHALETRINELDLTDTEKANALRADALFPVRQKNQDLLTQLAVCAQGYLALDVIRRNNDELVKGVERAASTTVAALRVAVTIAQALANQKMVIEQVNALRGTTEEIIATNAEMLASQSAEIQKIAADPAVSVETLRKSFESIYRTIDTIDAYKAQAVTNMGATVDALRTELERASTYLERSQHRNEREGRWACSGGPPPGQEPCTGPPWRGRPLRSPPPVPAPASRPSQPSRRRHRRVMDPPPRCGCSREASSRT